MPYADIVKQREYARAWYRKHSERMKEKYRDSYAHHLDEQRERSRNKMRRLLSTPQGKALHAERARRWRKNHPDEAREYRLRYESAHPHQTRARWAKRRHQIRSMPAIDYRTIVDEQGLFCRICSEFIEPRQLHIDHIYPIVRGGKHERDNLQVAHARCNLRKWIN